MEEGGTPSQGPAGGREGVPHPRYQMGGIPQPRSRQGFAYLIPGPRWGGGEVTPGYPPSKSGPGSGQGGTRVQDWMGYPPPPSGDRLA